MTVKRIDINYDVLCPNYNKNIDLDKAIGIAEMKRQDKILESEKLDEDIAKKKEVLADKTLVTEVSEAKTVEEAKKLLIKRLNVI